MKRRKLKSLTIKLPALVVLAACLGLLTSSVLAILIGRSVMREHALEANANSVQSYASGIYLYLENARSILQIAAELRNPDLFHRYSFMNLGQGGFSKQDTPERIVARDILRNSSVFEYVMLLRADGSIYLAEPSPLELKLHRQDLAFTDWYQRLISIRKTVISDLRISIATQRPTVAVAAPIISNDRIIGAWVGGLRLEELSKIGQGGLEAGSLQRWGYVTDRRGLIVAHQQNPNYVKEQTDFSSVPAVRAALLGQSDSAEWFNPVDEGERIGAYMPLAGLGWAVVYGTPTTVAYAPIDRITRNTLWASLAVFALMGSAGWIIAEKIAQRIKDLASASENIAAGNYAERIQVKTGDEIEQLALKFNQMAESLFQKETEARHHAEQLQQTSRMKSEFLANMSHELRTPLNAIIGFSEVLHDGKAGQTSETQKEYLTDILMSANHLLRLINDILDLSKVESGKMEFQPEPVELTTIVGEICDGVRTLTAQKKLDLQIAIDARINAVVLDPAKLKQILYNYVSNAIKFTPESGCIMVRATPEGETAFRLEVEDTGIGIKPEDVGKLFQDFQQLDSSLAKRYQGTGLGLALTKKLAEAQGGTVGVSSAAGRGSIFFLILPRHSGTEPSS